MSHSASTPARSPVRGPTQDPTLGGIVRDLTAQIPELIRSGIRPAQAEMAQKGTRTGIGIGLVSGAGLLAFFGLASLTTTAILALSPAVAAGLAALIVAVVLLVAAVLGLRGRSEVQQASPAAPERAVQGVEQDIATVKGLRG